MANILLALALAVILGLAGRYIYKAKKSGRKCIGCPGGCCSGEGASPCCRRDG